MEKIVTSTNIYGVYAIPEETLHRPAAKLVSEGKIFEPETIAFMRNNSRGADIVHAGTFFGDFLPGIAANANTVWAFEPNPRSFECAQKTIAMNRLCNVRLRNNALSDHQHMVRFQVRGLDGHAFGGASHIAGSNAPDECVVSVEAITVDSVVPSWHQIAILQLDLEGHEMPALKGAKGTIHRDKPILILEEIFDGDQVSEIVGLPYRYAGDLHRNGVFVAA